MFRLRSSIVAIGGVVVAVGLLTLVTPRAVHAVAAALVQVTNTASNPVVTQSVGQQAGQIVEVDCYIDYPAPSGPSFCGQFGSTSTASYKVPANENLVITAVDLATTPDGGNCGGTVVLGTATGPSFNPAEWTPRIILTNPANTGTLHLTYPTGFVFSAPQSPAIGVELGACIGELHLYGYTTSI